MKNTNFFSLLLAFSMATLFFSGCKRDDNDEDTGSAYDHSLAENAFNDAGNIAMESFDGSLASFKTDETIAGPCATVTHDSVAHTISIDFGTVNCMCNDNRNRRGIILVSYSGAYRDPGSSHTITFNNYFVNDNQILGTKTVTNTGLNTNGNLEYTITENGSVIRANGAGTITRISNRVREWLAGESTQIWSDDIYLITGTASGTNAAGDAFTASITTPLRKEMSCRNIVSGVIDFTPGSRPTRTIDFGTGTCDNSATVTINGHSRTITLP